MFTFALDDYWPCQDLDSKELDLLEVFSSNRVISFLEAGICNPQNPVFSGMGELEASFISEDGRGSIFLIGYSGASADRT